MFDRRTRISFTLDWVVLPGLLVSACWGQVATSQLLGTVQDSTGAAVAAVKVTATAVNTNVAVSTMSDEAGNYVFPQLPVGQYSLDVSHPGFKHFERTGIVLTVNQKARVDIRLEVGQVNESITIDANAELINTVDGETGHTIVRKTIVDLPLKGRQFLELAFLTPGAVNAPTDYRASLQGIAPAVNGNRPESNSYTLNGATNSEAFDGLFAIQPSVDSVEEFKIQTGSYNAEYGRAGGAIVNIVTKAGTNAFHGSLYEFLRNNHLNARNFFNPIKSPVKQNQYGGTIGGPVWKNRTFFFFNYEGYKERRASTKSSRFPTPQELNGDFSSFASVVKDPATGIPFPGNRIPVSQIDPIARKYSAIFPTPQPGLSGPINFINNQSAKVDSGAFGGRLDHNFSERDRTFLAVNWNDSDKFTPSPIPNGPGDDLLSFYSRLVNLTHTHLFSSSLTNEARLSYLRFDNPEINTYPRKDYPSELGLVDLPTDPNIRNRWPGLSFGQGYSGVPRTYEFSEVLNNYGFNDNLSWVRGAHNMKFGFGYNQTRLTETFIANAPTSWTFSGIFSGNAVADYLLGLASQNTTFLKGGRVYLYNSQYHFYAQDQWRVTKNVTVNYGLRYEIHLPWYDPRGTAGSFDPKTGAIIVTRLAPDVSDFARAANVNIERIDSKSFYPTNYCCVGPLMPRAGFAWLIPGLGNLTVRGGYGVSLNTEIGNIINGGLAPPFWIRTSSTLNNYPGIGFNRDRASLNNLGDLDAQPIASNFTEGYVQSWNLTLEKELRNGMFFSGAYVGSKGTHLAALGTWNEAPPGPGPIRDRRPFPKFGTFTSFENFGASNYHSLQTKAEKRFGNGLAYLLSYTYSKGLGNTGTLNEVRILTSYDKRSGRGRLPFDVRQRYSASFIYELPFGKAKRFLTGSSGFVNALVGGWQINNIYVAQTGYPINLSVTPCLVNGGLSGCPPNVNGTHHGNLPRGERGLDQWFNRSAFSAPPPYTFGNSQVWTLDGPTGLNNFDTSFVKNTRITESKNLQFRAEFYNLFNHTRFNSVDSALGSPNFGRITATTGEREVQLALKFLF